MTSESGVLSFLFCWLGPPGVSKAASASYMYVRGKRNVGGRGEKDRREEDGTEGKRKVNSIRKEEGRGKERRDKPQN